MEGLYQAICRIARPDPDSRSAERILPGLNDGPEHFDALRVNVLVLLNPLLKLSLIALNGRFARARRSAEIPECFIEVLDQIL